MTITEKPIQEILRSLQERAKELNCLYRADEILNKADVGLDEALRELVAAIPLGWQYPEACQAKISLHGQTYQSPGFRESAWVMTSDIVFEGDKVGNLSVYYTERKPTADEGPFLKEERRLINALAERIGYRLIQSRLRRALTGLEGDEAESSGRGKWSIILDFLRTTDRVLLVRITRRMINHLCWSGVGEAEKLLQAFAPGNVIEEATGDDNRPRVRTSLGDLTALAEMTFRIASSHLSEDEVVTCIETWIKEDKAGFLYDTLENLDTSLSEIANSVERFHGLSITESQLPMAAKTGLRVALLRRFFNDQLDFLNIAKQFVEIGDFHDLVRHVVYLPDSHGKLGGKSAGLFLASKIVLRSTEYHSVLSAIKVPKTWYLTSDGLLQFIRYNSLEDIYDRKYRSIDEIRMGYPYLVQVFKNSPFPPELTKGLSAALDDFEGKPVIVRSSSLLEDQVGSAFSGKYKSLFLANQGSKRERLAALEDAIAEVYASVFAPDPIEYRAERGLLDFHEEMGIMLQEVVGRRVGKYFLPAFAGVAFSNNEFRWSSRIKREDGLVRLVPGLGTRAVDRLTDDYPVLLAPGQPGLRANVTPDEIIRYSPKKVDVINLETNEFETIDVEGLLRRHGGDFPMIRRIVSVVQDGRITGPVGLGPDFEKQDLIVTFDGLARDTSFVTQIGTLLKLLKERLGVPVDIEFASDGEDFYLLQCRSQSYTELDAPAAIPRDLPRDRVVFSANRYVSNGLVPDITHIVYVDPERYAELPDAATLRQVGRAVGKLNNVLPKRQFILMGPGRWGSRGDIKLGVSVTYSDISNTAVLVEIARKRGHYLPDLSFGTHFFQDLVEANIRYLPLYPDDQGVQFNEPFLRGSTNMLADLLPDFAHLAEAVRVIDVRRETDGRVLRVLMNADLEEAVGVLAEPSAESAGRGSAEVVAGPATDDHWRWRMRMAERIAAEIDPDRFGVRALYVFGSTKNATAGAGSDLDLLVHVGEDPEQRRLLGVWLDGWSQALAEINYLRTGYRTDGLLDVHYVTDDDIARQTTYAAKIGAVTDAARPLTLKKAGTATSSE